MAQFCAKIDLKLWNENFENLKCLNIFDKCVIVRQWTKAKKGHQPKVPMNSMEFPWMKQSFIWILWNFHEWKINSIFLFFIASNKINKIWKICFWQLTFKTSVRPISYFRLGRTLFKLVYNLLNNGLKPIQSNKAKIGKKIIF